MSRRIFISELAYDRLKELVEENKDKLTSNRGVRGMVDLLVLGKTTSKGSGRRKKIL